MQELEILLEPSNGDKTLGNIEEIKEEETIGLGIENNEEEIVDVDTENFEEQIITMSIEEFQEMATDLESEPPLPDSIVEKDPTVPQHVKNITEEDIKRWDEGSEVDTSAFYTKSEIDNKGYLTSIPSEYVTDKELNSKGYLTSIPNEYVTETELNNKGYIKTIPSEYITETELNNKGYLTSIPNDVVRDTNYVHTDNNYTTAEKNKLKGIEANANNYVLPSDVVKDSKYVHTDNNFTNADKEKLDGLESLSGKASDISYEDNYGYGGENVQEALDQAFAQIDNGFTAYDIGYVDNTGQGVNNLQDAVDDLYNRSENVPQASDISYEDNYGYGGTNVQDALDVAFARIDDGFGAESIGYIDNMGYDVNSVQDALDKAFDTLDNKMDYQDFRDDFDQTIGDIQDLETTDTSNIVNAINSLIGQSGGSGGIPELSGDINIYNLDSGVYLLSGKSTRLLRNSYVWMTQPVPYEAGKSILVLTREAEFGEQGFLLKATQASPYVQLIAFDRTTQKEYNAMQLMSMTNTTSYNVTSDYQPAHKKYVDDKCNAILSQVGGITDLGVIDLEEYEDDVSVFMATLTETGQYHFQDGWDYFDWYIEVQAMGNRAGQWYWYTEEGYTVQYYRDGWYNEDEDMWEFGNWQSNVTWKNFQYQLNQLDNRYSLSGHTHTSSTILTSGTNFREWLNKQKYKTFIDFLVKINGTWERYVCKFYYDSQIRDSKFVYYQEYYEVSDPSKIYKRIGTAPSASTSATVTWQPWYVFEATQEEE